MNEESLEFTEWWNEDFDPNETGRARMIASHAFEAGRAFERTKRNAAILQDHDARLDQQEAA